VAKKFWVLFLCVFLVSISFGCGKKAETDKKKEEKKNSEGAEQTFMQKNAAEYAGIKATTGMSVYVPEYLPAGIEIERVLKVRETSANPAYYEVDYTKGLTISGSSNPAYKTDAEFTGEFDAAGRHYEEHSYQSNEKSYQVLWHTSKGTYIVSVNTSEGITKEDVRKIAESVKPAP